MVEDFEFAIDDAHFEYLAIQRGAVSDFRHDRAAWCRAYRDSVLDIYRSLVRVLPETCASVLDIGSGLGGIDAALNRHYGGNVAVALLDGKASEARVVQRDLPFSNAAVAEDFQRKNEVCVVSCVGPEDIVEGKFDLIVSFAAYAFHIAPEAYLEKVMQACKPQTVCVFDVRTARPDWLKDLAARFGRSEVLWTANKYQRIAFLEPL